MKPAQKDQQIENLLNAVVGKHRGILIELSECISCKGKAEEFKNERSKREHAISGMCQKCQDGFFDAEEPDWEE